MAANPISHIEGQWEELIRHPDQFAGCRVRVTVLSDGHGIEPTMAGEVHRWLAEVHALDLPKQPFAKPDAFTDGLTEKFRKQGLVL